MPQVADGDKIARPFAFVLPDAGVGRRVYLHQALISNGRDGSSAAGAWTPNGHPAQSRPPGRCAGMIRDLLKFEFRARCSSM